MLFRNCAIQTGLDRARYSDPLAGCEPRLEGMSTWIFLPSPATSLPSFVEVPPNLTPGTTSPSLNLICFWGVQLPRSQEKSFLRIWKSAGALSCAEMGHRDCCELTDPAGLRHPSPARPQESQKLSSTVCLTGEHSELQKGLKGKQRRQKFVLISFFIVPHPLPPQPSCSNQAGQAVEAGSGPQARSQDSSGLHLHPR